MNIYVMGVSALAHYRNTCAAADEDAAVEGRAALEDAASSRLALDESRVRSLGIGEPSVDEPLHVLVPRAGQRGGRGVVVPHVWSAPLPESAFREVREGLYVSSPEFLFLQMASVLDPPQLVELGMELCGTYRRKVKIDSQGIEHEKPITEYQLPPLTTPRKLRSFVNNAGKVRGVKAARWALDYVLSDSASPMETILFLLLCLPRRLGGYGLAQPTLNPIIKISKAGRRFTLRRSSKPDLYWRDKKLDLEYNSDEWHDERQRTWDSMRRKALERMGVEVIELTKDEVESADLFHATVLRIARRLGKQIRPLNEGSFASRRDALRQELFNDETLVTPQRKVEPVGQATVRYMRDEDVLYEGDVNGVPAYDSAYLADGPDGNFLVDDALYDEMSTDGAFGSPDLQFYIDELP